MVRQRVLSALAALAFVFGATAAAAEDIGSVTRLQGAAGILRGDLPLPASLGQAVQVGDILVTGAAARLEVTFRDRSVLTLGGDGRITVDGFVFDPTDEQGAATQAINVATGIFSFVSGAIEDRDPAQVAVRTPVATIGIRGTAFRGGALFAGMPPGQLHYGFQVLDGTIAVTNPFGAVVLDDPGEGTFLPLDGTAAPTPVRQWSEEADSEIAAGLRFAN